MITPMLKGCSPFWPAIIFAATGLQRSSSNWFATVFRSRKPVPGPLYPSIRTRFGNIIDTQPEPGHSTDVYLWHAEHLTPADAALRYILPRTQRRAG